MSDTPIPAGIAPAPVTEAPLPRVSSAPTTGAPIRVFHVSASLDTGGAEVMLLRLLTAMDRARFSAEVVSLKDVGAIGARIQALGIPVHALGMRTARDVPRAIVALTRLLAGERPDVVQTWMTWADLLGGLAATAAGRIPLAWGLHQGSIDPAGTHYRKVRWTLRALGVLSSTIPSRIVCCSESARTLHLGFGYAADRMVVIPNGFDLSQFAPDPSARPWLRRELGLADDAPIIGLVGRFHPQKDHRTFFAAASLLHVVRPDVQFVVCGDGLRRDNAELGAWIDEAGVIGAVHLLGRRDDVPRLTAAFDLATSSSAFGEAFPLVIGEAMACAVPCVVTDTGDSAIMVGDTGLVVPIRDPGRLAQAWHEMLSLSPERRGRLGQKARARIEAHYSLASIAARYEAVYLDLADRKRRLVAPREPDRA